MGSTRVARNAGTKAAKRATTASRAEVPAKTAGIGGAGAVEQRAEQACEGERRRQAERHAGAGERRMPWRSTMPSTAAPLAPSAMRTPISRGALRDRIGDHAVEAHGGEQQGHGGEHAEQREREARSGFGRRRYLFHAADVVHRLVLIHGVDRALRGGQPSPAGRPLCARPGSCAGARPAGTAGRRWASAACRAPRSARRQSRPRFRARSCPSAGGGR